jgi:signal transduction histidine kinase
MNLAVSNSFSDIIPAKAPRSRFEDVGYLDFMCHEIGTPLSAIIGLSHILTNVDCSIEKKKECAEMLRNSSSMLMGLMKNMLDTSKIEAGMIKIESIDFDLLKVVQEAVQIVSLKAAEKGLDLKVNIEDGFPKQYLGDPLRMCQILVNLLSNAIKFTEKGAITISVSTKLELNGRNQLCIAVSDTGIGMSEDELANIFSKYTQANSTISRKYGGTGLGLSICRDLAQLMQGDVSVESQLNVGSVFTLTLPLKKSLALL